VSAADQSGEKAPRGRIALLAQIATLAVTACLLWVAAGATRFHRFSLGALFVEALGYALLAWLWSAAIAFGLYAVIPHAERGDLTENVLRTSTTAIWFAPATILLAHLSPGALIAAPVLVVAASRLLYCQWRIGAADPLDPPPYQPAPELFERSFLPAGPLWRELGPDFVAAMAAQGSAWAALMRYPLTASGLFVLVAAMLTVFALSRGAWEPRRQPSLPKAVQAIAATVVLATTLTVGGLAPRIPRGGSYAFDGDSHGAPGAAASLRELLRNLFSPRKSGASPQEAAREEAPPEAAVGMAPGGFPGVILWPVVKPVTTLIAPLPAGRAAFAGARNPLGIPFGGEYWMYRWPFVRPPAKSYFQRGSPASLSFSTTDHAPLQMEARQKLEQSIDVRCCAEIRIEILNADRYPETVWLELFLIDQNSPGAPSQSLGFQPVLSAPQMDVEPPRPARETLSFRIPASPNVMQFDQFRVTFRRERSRNDKSARISIERFVLIPRGLL